MLYSDGNGEHAPSTINELRIRKALNIFYLFDKIGENKIRKMKTKFAFTLFALSKDDVEHVAKEVEKRDSYFGYVAEFVKLEDDKKHDKEPTNGGKKHDKEPTNGDKKHDKKPTSDGNKPTNDVGYETELIITNA